MITFKNTEGDKKFIYDTWGIHRVVFATIQLDTSYPSGGYGASLGFSPGAFGLKSFRGVQILGYNAAGSGIIKVEFDYTNNKLMAFRVATFTPAGTVAAPVFTGTPLAAHSHKLRFQTPAAANAVTAAANALRTPAAAFSVNGVPDETGEGGVVDITGGTPAGTNSAPAFTGTAQGQVAFAQVTAAVNLNAVTVRVMAIGRPA